LERAQEQQRYEETSWAQLATFRIGKPHGTQRKTTLKGNGDAPFARHSHSALGVSGIAQARLGGSSRSTDPGNARFLSPVSIWEFIVLLEKEKITVRQDFGGWLSNRRQRWSWRKLGLEDRS
jgi:hypothetical protein